VGIECERKDKKHRKNKDKSGNNKIETRVFCNSIYNLHSQCKVQMATLLFLLFVCLQLIQRSRLIGFRVNTNMIIDLITINP